MEVLGEALGCNVGSAEWGLGGSGDDGGEPPVSQIVTIDELKRGNDADFQSRKNFLCISRAATVGSALSSSSMTNVVLRSGLLSVDANGATKANGLDS